jgi:hypothetical protein
MKWRRFTLQTILLMLLAGSSSITAAEEMKNESIFVTVAYPQQWSEANTLLLVESIRTFGGELSKSPVWCLVPDYGKQPSEIFKEKLAALEAELVSFDIDLEVARFFFAADIRAAAIAESMAVAKTDLLIWLSSNTIILKEPADFLLGADKNLGYRPVHHINIGSLYDKPLDAFWSQVYAYCDVPEERVFPMQTHVDTNLIRPYFNAGMMVVRPDRHLFKAWHDKFFDVYRAPALAELYGKDERYVIFIHQALLSGIILAMFSRDEIQELPGNYNYPLHLFEEDVTEHRPSSFADLITVRHEGFDKISDWIEKIPGGRNFNQWLVERAD